MSERCYFTVTTALIQLAIGLLMLFLPSHLPGAYDPFRPLLPWYGLAWILPGLVRLLLRLEPGALRILVSLWSAVNFILLGIVFAVTALSGTTTYMIIGVMILVSVVPERV